MPADRRNAVITGSAGGLGRALAVRLAQRGYRLLLADVDEAGNAETASAVANAGGEASCAQLEVADPIAWKMLHDRLRTEWPRLDLLVNNAGMAAAGCVGEMPLEHWRRVIDVNLFGAIHGCHTFVPWLKQNAAGAHLVNVASFASFVSFPEMAAYNVSKAGVVSLSETLRSELAGDRVGVTVVSPGFFASGLARSALMQTEWQREFTEQAMREAKISADDVADAVLQAVAANRPYVVLPGRAKRYWFLKRFWPGYFLRRIASHYQQEKGRRNAQP